MIGLNLEMLKSTGRVSELRDRMESGRASLVAQMVICLQCRRPGFDPLVRKIPWRR